MTMATTIAAIRRILNDFPDEDTLGAAIAAANTTTMTVTDITKHFKGKVFEFDDATGDVVLETAVNGSTSVVTIKRGHLGSTAAAHLIGAVMLDNPRYRYDQITQAVNTVLDADLFHEGLFELQEHQITSSATTDYYNSPAAGCLRFLDVYQKTSTMYEPRREAIWYSPYPTNVDTSLYASGKYFVINGNYGVAGTAIYYVTCAHAYEITTLSTAAQRIVELLACAYLLEWSEPRRLGGPNNQGDITVKPGQSVGTAAYYRGLAEELMVKERRKTSELFPSKRNFVRN